VTVPFLIVYYNDCNFQKELLYMNFSIFS